MSDPWVYPYVHDNYTNLLTNKVPYWSYVPIPEEHTTARWGVRIRASEYAAYTAARPLVTYVQAIGWYTTVAST